MPFPFFLNPHLSLVSFLISPRQDRPVGRPSIVFISWQPIARLYRDLTDETLLFPAQFRRLSLTVSLTSQRSYTKLTLLVRLFLGII
jgi:hypothetical protein